MYQRITKKSFDKYIERLNHQKRLTKNQYAWEYEKYKLNNRLAAAEKRGFVFREDIIPTRPAKVTAKAIEQLAKIKGDVALFAASDYAEANKLSVRAVKKLYDTFVAKGKADLTSTAEGEAVIINTVNVPASEPKTQEIPPQDVTQPNVISDDFSEPESPRDYAKEYYGNDDERTWAGDDAIEDVDYTILTNAEDLIQGADIRNDDDRKLFGENERIKRDAKDTAWKLINDAMMQYGRKTVAKRMNESSEDVLQVVEAILHWYYIGHAEMTEERTDARLHLLAEILYDGDISASLLEDFGEG